MDGGSWHFTGDRDQDHPEEKEMQKAKWLFEEALQIAKKRREAKGKGERKDLPNWMQSSKESQGEIKKPFSVINANRGKQQNGKD